MINPRSDRLSIDLTVISAEDLSIKGKQIRSNTFAIVKIGEGNNSKYAMTKIDPESGSYPYWDEKLLLDLPLNANFITVEVRRGTNFSGEGQFIASARIPVSDFMGGYAPENYLHFLSYRLRDAAGMRNGIVNVSVRVRSVGYKCSTSAQPEMGIPAVAGQGSGGGGGTVTGIPVSYPYHHLACRS